MDPLRVRDSHLEGPAAVQVGDLKEYSIPPSVERDAGLEFVGAGDVTALPLRNSFSVYPQHVRIVRAEQERYVTGIGRVQEGHRVDGHPIIWSKMRIQAQLSVRADRCSTPANFPTQRGRVHRAQRLIQFRPVDTVQSQTDLSAE